jgi:hypothetical protein
VAVVRASRPTVKELSIRTYPRHTEVVHVAESPNIRTKCASLRLQATLLRPYLGTRILARLAGGCAVREWHDAVAVLFTVTGGGSLRAVLRQAPMVLSVKHADPVGSAALLVAMGGAAVLARHDGNEPLYHHTRLALQVFRTLFLRHVLA